MQLKMSCYHILLRFVNFEKNLFHNNSSFFKSLLRTGAIQKKKNIFVAIKTGSTLILDSIDFYKQRCIKVLVLCFHLSKNDRTIMCMRSV